MQVSQFFLITQSIALIAIVILFFLLSMVWPPDSPWSPWWRTSRKIARRMCALAKIGKKDILYELGCGDGSVILTAAKEFGAKAVGIEIDPLRAMVAQLRMRFHQVSERVTIVKKNFKDVPISDATVLYLYLVPRAILRIKQKLLTELKPGTRVISYVYPIDYLHLKIHDKQHKIFIYDVPKLKKETMS